MNLTYTPNASLLNIRYDTVDLMEFHSVFQLRKLSMWMSVNRNHNGPCSLSGIPRYIQPCIQLQELFSLHIFWLTCGEPMRSRGVRRLQRHPLACFVTAGAIDLKLRTYVPQSKSNSLNKFRSSLIVGLATRWPKHKKCDI
jgi:hypothetical protein